MLRIEMASAKGSEPPPYSSDPSLTEDTFSNDRNQHHRGRRYTRYNIDRYYFAPGIFELVSGLTLIITPWFTDGNNRFEEALLSSAPGLGIAQLASIARRFTLSFNWNQVPPPAYATRVFWVEVIFIILSFGTWVGLSFAKAKLLEHNSHKAERTAV